MSNTPGWLQDGLAAGAASYAPSGLPSTVYALAKGHDPLTATRAAGSVLLPRETRTLPLVLAAGVVHAALSVGWASLLARTLPARRTAAWGAAAGLAICVLDIGILGRRFPRVRALPFVPQLADHLVFGAVVGEIVARRRASRSSPSRA